MDSYSGSDVNTVLQTVSRLSKDGDVQLSIIAHALVIACKSTQVDFSTAVGELKKLWANSGTMITLPGEQ